MDSQIEQLGTTLRQMTTGIGIAQTLWVFLAGATAWLVVDYARMLLLRRKMVSTKPPMQEHARNKHKTNHHPSHQAHSPTP